MVAVFEKAVEDVKNLKGTPPDEDLLKVYALYKQATVGDVNTSRPGLLDLKGKAKWDAWNALKGKSKDEAQQEYIALTNKLVSTYGLK